MPSDDQNHEIIPFKVAVVGDAGTGKTEFLKKLTSDSDNFNAAYEQTIGVNYATHTIQKAKVNLRLQLWDIGGQKRFEKMANLFYKEAKAVIFVTDIRHLETIEILNQWHQNLQKDLSNYDEIPKILIISKCDRIHEKKNLEKLEEQIKKLNELIQKIGFEAKNIYACSAKENCMYETIWETQEDKTLVRIKEIKKPEKTESIKIKDRIPKDLATQLAGSKFQKDIHTTDNNSKPQAKHPSIEIKQPISIQKLNELKGIGDVQNAIDNLKKYCDDKKNPCRRSVAREFFLDRIKRVSTLAELNTVIEGINSLDESILKHRQWGDLNAIFHRSCWGKEDVSSDFSAVMRLAKWKMLLLHKSAQKNQFSEKELEDSQKFLNTHRSKWGWDSLRGYGGSFYSTHSMMPKGSSFFKPNKPNTRNLDLFNKDFEPKDIEALKKAVSDFDSKRNSI